MVLSLPLHPSQFQHSHSKVLVQLSAHFDKMEAPLNLTFGVEFEFIVRFNPDDYEPYMSQANGILWHGTGEQQFLGDFEKFPIMVRSHIIAALSKHGIPVNSYRRNGVPERGYGKWGVVPDGSINPGPESLDPRWIESGFTGVEVRTPAYYLSRFAIEQIRQVLHLLTLHFDIFVNPSCGLHVHVGNAHAGFPVRTLKNFCILITAFERQLNSLHPLHRIQNLYAKPPGRIFPPTSPWEKVLAIDALKTIPEIVERFNTFDYLPDAAVAYNLANLHYTDKKTIEFRQHAATMDPIAVIMWVETVTGLVNLSHQSPYPAFVGLLQNHINDLSFSVIDLLHSLDLHRVADYYAHRGIYTHPRQEWDWFDPVLILQRKAIEDNIVYRQKQLLEPETDKTNVESAETENKAAEAPAEVPAEAPAEAPTEAPAEAPTEAPAKTEATTTTTKDEDDTNGEGTKQTEPNPTTTTIQDLFRSSVGYEKPEIRQSVNRRF